MSEQKRNHRVNVNFSESAWRTLQELAEKQGKTLSGVLRDAIALERWFHEAHERGERVMVERNGKVREVIPRVTGCVMGSGWLADRGAK